MRSLELRVSDQTGDRKPLSRTEILWSGGAGLLRRYSPSQPSRVEGRKARAALRDNARYTDHGEPVSPTHLGL